jgi:hypothetical protein
MRRLILCLAATLLVACGDDPSETKKSTKPATGDPIQKVEICTAETFDQATRECKRDERDAKLRSDRVYCWAKVAKGRLRQRQARRRRHHHRLRRQGDGLAERQARAQGQVDM